MIDFKKVNLRYKEGVRALDDVNIHVDKGEFVFIVGQSGAGKSSLVKAMLKEVNIDSGEIIVDSTSVASLHKRLVPHLRRRVGMVFQDFRLLSKKTVYENVAYAMQIMGFSSKLIRDNVPIALKLVGLLDKSDYYPHKLSGGEAQRVSIARAMVNKPSILIADEPTGNLDSKTSREILKILMALNSRGTTVVVITHDEELVRICKTRVIEMREGRIVSDNKDLRKMREERGLRHIREARNTINIEPVLESGLGGVND